MEKFSKGMNKEKISRKFKKMIEEFIKEHEDVLKELAKR